MISAATFFPVKLTPAASGAFHVLVNLGPEAVTAADSASVATIVWIAIRIMTVPS